MKCATAFPPLRESCRKPGCSRCASCRLSRAYGSWDHYIFMSSTKAAYGHLQQSFLEQVASAVAVALDDCLAHEEVRRLGDELSARKIAELEQQQRRMSDALQETSKALDASEERFRDLFDEAPIAYVHEGLDSRFIRANRTAMRILGIKPEDVPTTYGKTFAPDTPDAQRRMREAFESIGRGTDTSGVVLEMRRKDNGKPFWIQWWSRPDPSGTYTRTMFLDITDRVLMEQEKARLEAQNIYLQEEIRSEHNFVEIVGNSRSLLAVLRQVDQVAPTDATVLIQGETGTGKELIARAIHDRSPRRGRPLVKVNCGAISAGLVESELFGHVKGAFTGALANRDGRFALADGGTIFLDEVGELPPDTQVKLLRVLQEQEFEPIGSSKTIKVDVRVIAATNRDLSLMVREGKFRSDLFYRLNVFPVTMPPLRERQEDVPLLTMFFLEKFARKLGRPIAHVAGGNDVPFVCVFLAGQYPGTAKRHRTRGRAEQRTCANGRGNCLIRFFATGDYGKHRGQNPDSITAGCAGLKQCPVARRGRAPAHRHRAHASELADRGRPRRGKIAQSSAKYVAQPDAEAGYRAAPGCRLSTTFHDHPRYARQLAAFRGRIFRGRRRGENVADTIFQNFQQPFAELEVCVHAALETETANELQST